MGKLVKFIGSGVGLAAEAMAHHREKSRSRSPSTSHEPRASSSRNIPDDAPPAYEQVYEIPDERADELVQSGKAVPVKSKAPYEKARLEKEKSTEEDDSDSSTDVSDLSRHLIPDCMRFSFRLNPSFWSKILPLESWSTARTHFETRLGFFQTQG